MRDVRSVAELIFALVYPCPGTIATIACYHASLLWDSVHPSQSEPSSAYLASRLHHSHRAAVSTQTKRYGNPYCGYLMFAPFRVVCHRAFVFSTELVCPAGLVYVESGPACNATCDDPDAPENCPIQDVQACACADETMVVVNDMCVPSATCGCTDPHGNKHMVRSSLSVHSSHFVGVVTRVH